MREFLVKTPELLSSILISCEAMEVSSAGLLWFGRIDGVPDKHKWFSPTGWQSMREVTPQSPPTDRTDSTGA